MKIDEALDQFEQEWKAQRPPDLRRVVQGLNRPSLGRVSAKEFVYEFVMIDFWHRWRCGAKAIEFPPRRNGALADHPSSADDAPWPRFPRLDEYAKRYSDLLDWTDLPAELIGEEYRVRRWFGDHPTHDEYLRRFPRQSDQLPAVFAHIDAQTRGGLHDITVESSSPPLEAAIAPSTSVPATIGKYQILAPLDRGGQGRVYRAMHPELRQELAIKLGHRIAGQGESERNALVAEARVLAQLDHPNLIRVHDLGFHEGCPYVVLDYVPGRNLRELSRSQPLSPERAAEIVAKIARAVAAAHAHGVVHLDLKPSNILIDQHGEPRLIDFGLARQRSTWSPQDETNSQVAGTLLYMAPEQAYKGSTKVGPRTDVYGLGAVLFDLLTGQPPRKTDSNEKLLEQARAGKIDAEALSAFHIPQPLARICLKALSADTQARQESAESLAAALDSWRNRAGPRAFWSKVATVAALVVIPLLILGAGLLATGGRQAVRTEPTLEENAAAVIGHKLHHDFQLQFEMVGQPTGEVAKLDDGQEIALTLLSEVDCYVGVWHVDSAGKATLLFPNDKEHDHLLRAGQSLTVPGRDGYAIAVSESSGAEYFWAAAITQPWDAEVGQVLGPAIVLAAPGDLQRGGKRPAKLVERDSFRASERVVPIEVSPRAGPDPAASP